MKLKNTSLAILAAALLAACGGKTSTESTTETIAVDTVAYTVDPSASVVNWKGEVAGVYGHNGVINIAEGSVSVAGSQITGGTIVIDMKSIQPTDSASYKDEDGRRATDLVGHLSTGDFFLVEEYPTASFVIKAQSGNELIGDLTIRGITKEYKATITSFEAAEGSLKASADLVFNRQDFKVSWVHFMKDMVLSDDISIKLNIVAKS